MAWDDDEDDDYDDGPEPDEDDETTVPCPYCRAPVFDDAERCPSCGAYLSVEDAPRRPRPWWFVASVWICVIALLFWVNGLLKWVFP